MATLSLQADRFQLATIRNFVMQTSRDLGLNERVIQHLELAVDEACTNVVQHAYDEQGGKIEITIELLAAGVQVVIRDWGATFDPRTVPIPDVTAPLQQRSPGGLGLFLMRQLMDQVDFQFDAERGNTLTMMKRLDGRE